MEENTNPEQQPNEVDSNSTPDASSTPENETEAKKPEGMPDLPEMPQVAPPASEPLQASAAATQFGRSLIDLSLINDKVEEARVEIEKFVIGQHEMIDLMLVGVFTNGHILLEGVPGIAKTLAAKVMACTMKADFARVQFTPDLMPSDIIGTSVFNMKTTEFTFKKGPIFTNVALIDEINRAPAKTQAALFEVMEERQVTFDGVTHKMEFPFLIIATQNPIEQEGTYRLPEAQLDRFLFKINLSYPSVKEEAQILERYKNDMLSADLSSVKPVFASADLKKIQDLIGQVRVEDSLIRYIAELTNETRNHGKLYLGASPRASLALLKASKAIAAMRGRDFIVPDDVQYLASDGSD